MHHLSSIKFSYMLTKQIKTIVIINYLSAKNFYKKSSTPKNILTNHSGIVLSIEHLYYNK